MPIPFDQVYQKIKDKQLDCLITAALPAHTARFYQLATHIYTMPPGWSIVMRGVNQTFWDKIRPDDQPLLTTRVKQLANQRWQAAALQTEQGLAGNTGNNCNLPEQGVMTRVSPAAANGPPGGA